MAKQFTKATEEYISKTSIKYRKKLGQYFTPKFVREKLLQRLPQKRKPRVLDPSCGTGEFLLSAKKYFNQPELVGWEVDSKLTDIIKAIYPDIVIKATDSLLESVEEKFDFVIGNPPYFEGKPKEEIRKRYADVISGRPNIFSMFIKLGLELLKPDGYLAYVVPPSMNNGAYFKALREYITTHANIEYLERLNSPQIFHNAQQTVMLLVLKKTKNRGTYIFKKNGITIFTPDKSKLQKAFQNKTTLSEIGFEVRTGKIVWNKNKNLLTNNEKGIPLIWSHNITPTGLKFNNHKSKKQYVNKEIFDKGPAIVVNRISGNPATAKLKAALIKPGMKFLAENHVNVIYPPENFKKNTKLNSSILKNITDQISSEKTANTMKLITGNSQISKTELEKLLPIDKISPE